MKIGIDARLIGQTGVGRYIKNLVFNLAEIDKKNNYILFVRSQDKKVFKSLKFKIIETDIRWHSISEQIKFPKILKNENLDLVHFPYFSVPVFYNRPYVVTIHDLILHHFPTGQASTLFLPIYWSKMFAYKYVISRAAGKAKKIITVSNSTKDEIIDHLKIDPEKIEVVYEGIDNQITNPKSQIPDKSLNAKYPGLAKRSGAGKILNTKYFIYVGNVYPHKNVNTLIDAFNSLLEKEKECSLMFVGREDFFYKRLKAKVKSNKNIEFLDYVSDGELAWLYQNAVATVCPAFMEGFGLPALEAMANNCLVITSDVPAFREICKDNAIYFNPKDPNELSEKMSEVLNNKEKFENLIEEGFKRSQDFSWRKMSEQTLKIYENAVK